MKRKQKGFTLVEVMTALLVLALVLLGIFRLQSALIRNSSHANGISAVALTQGKIDGLQKNLGLMMVTVRAVAFTHHSCHRIS